MSQDTIGVPLWHSRLRIQRCHCSGSSHCYGVGSIHGHEVPHSMGIYGQTNKQTNKNTIKKVKNRSSHCGTAETNLTRNHEAEVLKRQNQKKKKKKKRKKVKNKQQDGKKYLQIIYLIVSRIYKEFLQLNNKKDK